MDFTLVKKNQPMLATLIFNIAQRAQVPGVRAVGVGTCCPRKFRNTRRIMSTRATLD
jgi:hypothetical protein